MKLIIRRIKNLPVDLIAHAEFSGKYEMPVIHENKKIIKPVDMIPFDKRNKHKDETELFINFYIHDNRFVQILSNPDKYIKELKRFKGVISPDFSLYRDMPYGEQFLNTYINRALASYMQSQGLYVIPNVRWSDSRSFDYCFDGLARNSIYCISTLGCIKSREDKYYFKQGLDVFIKRLEPKIVLVYGAMPAEVFSDYMTSSIRFINYKSYTSRVFDGEVY